MKKPGQAPREGVARIMSESVILSTPLLWLIFGTALGLCLFDKVYRATRGLFTAASAVVTVIGCAVALILGAGYGEVIIVLLVFFLLEMEGWK